MRELPVVERGIPIPALGHARYPLSTLAVGESFAVPLSGETFISNTGHEVDRTLGRVSRSANNYKTRTGRRFTVRTLKDEGVVRCWRIA